MWTYHLSMSVCMCCKSTKSPMDSWRNYTPKFIWSPVFTSPLTFMSSFSWSGATIEICIFSKLHFSLAIYGIKNHKFWLETSKNGAKYIHSVWEAQMVHLEMLEFLYYMSIEYDSLSMSCLIDILLSKISNHLHLKIIDLNDL